MACWPVGLGAGGGGAEGRGPVVFESACIAVLYRSVPTVLASRSPAIPPDVLDGVGSGTEGVHEPLKRLSAMLTGVLRWNESEKCSARTEYLLWKSCPITEYLLFARDCAACGKTVMK